MKTKSEIRKTTPADLNAVMKIYAQAQAEMIESGNPYQWGDAHPPRALIEADIAAGKSYVLADEMGWIFAVFYFAVEDDPTYTHIDGAWLDADAPYGVVHRIARAPEARGAGAACMEWAFARCGNVRIDTMEANTPMQKMLARLGYTRCGIIRLGLFDDAAMDERIAYQKVKS